MHDYRLNLILADRIKHVSALDRECRGWSLTRALAGR